MIKKVQPTEIGCTFIYKFGFRGRVRTYAYRIQSPVPYQLGYSEISILYIGYAMAFAIAFILYIGRIEYAQIFTEDFFSQLLI